MGDSVLESVDFEIILSKKKVLINVNILPCFFKQIFLILEVSETIQLRGKDDICSKVFSIALPKGSTLHLP